MDLFFWSQIRASFGNWMAHYSRFRVKEGTEVDAFDFMPHEEAPKLSFEEERLKALKRNLL